MKKILLFGLVFLLLSSFASAALTDNIVAYWKFDGDATDAVSTNDGSVSGATLTTGLINQGYDFDGSNDYIQFDSHINLFNTNEGTLNIWFNLDTLTGTHNIFRMERSDASSNDIFSIIYYESITSLDIYQKTGSTTSFDLYGSPAYSVNANEWNMVTVTSDGSTVKVYINGAFIGSASSTSWLNNLIANGATYVQVGYGRRTSGGPLDGKADELSYWSQALNSTEVLELYDAQKDGFSSGQYPSFGVSSANLTINANANNFTVEVDGFGNYSTTSGTVTTDIVMNQSRTLDLFFYDATNGTEERPFLSRNYTSQSFNQTNYTFTATLNPYMKVNASNLYNGSKISTFNVTYGSITYNSNADGNVFLPSYNEIISFTTSASNYFDTTTSSHNSSTDKEVELYQSKLQVRLLEYLKNNEVQEPWTFKIDGSTSTCYMITNLNGSRTCELRINAGTFNVTGEKAGYFSQEKNITTTAKTTTTENFEVSAYQLVIDAKQVKTLAAINNFTVSYSHSGTFTHSGTITTTDGSVVLLVNNDTLNNYYDLEITAEGYANINASARVYINTTGNITQTFLLFNEFELDVSFYSDANNSIITGQQINYTIIGTQLSINGTTSNGTFTQNVVSPGDYIISYEANGFNYGNYIVSFDNGDYKDLVLYLVEGSGTEVDIFVYDNVGDPLENATVKIQKLINNSYTVIFIDRTNFAGQMQAKLDLGSTFYKFLIEYNDVTVKVTEPTKIYKTLLNFYVDTSGVDSGILDKLYTITYSLNYDNTTNKTTYFYNDANNLITQGCIYVYENSLKTSTLLNSTCGSAVTDTLNDYLNEEKKYTVVGTVDYSGQQYFISSLVIDKTIQRPPVSNAVGYFFATLLFLIIAALGIYYPPIAFAFGSVAIIALIYLNFISFAVGMPIAIVGMVLAFVVGGRI